MAKNNTGWVKAVSLKPPTLTNNTADSERLLIELKSRVETDHIETDLCLMKQLPDLLRQNNYHIRCVLYKCHGKWTLAGITGTGKADRIIGLAVDLGTTRVVIRLIDLLTNSIVNERSFDNPQISIGPDILSRIHHADQPGGLDHLNSLIINGINKEISLLCNENAVDKNDIYLLAVAGNTAMTHLFLNLTPHWIIREPYIPVTNTPGLVRADDIGITVNPCAKVFIFPNIGSYFGGDLIAGILYSGLYRSEETAILVDVGTNAEVVLGNKSWLIGCAGAAGPALEGGVTRMGMMAGAGVIDRITIDPETRRFHIHTIDDALPRGICGSGLIDLAAHLFLTGMIDIRGKFVSAKCGDKLKGKNGIHHLIVVPSEESATGEDLTISQVDIDSLVRSKAAMYTILETITSSVGIMLNELATFYVAGTFGSFIRPESAISIGMIPDLPIESYKSLGNSSLGGATMALTSSEYADDIGNIRDKITYLELNVNQEFMNRFSAARFFPHTDRSRFPNVKPCF